MFQNFKEVGCFEGRGSVKAMKLLSGENSWRLAVGGAGAWLASHWCKEDVISSYIISCKHAIGILPTYYVYFGSFYDRSQESVSAVMLSLNSTWIDHDYTWPTLTFNAFNVYMLRVSVFLCVCVILLQITAY